MVKTTVKWGKEAYEVELNPASPVAEFRAQLFSLTGVPPDRQKLMSKAWKAVLKDDMDFSTMSLSDGLVISLMGSADTIAKPAEKVVFVEDMSAAEVMKVGHRLPSGFVNTGNTCYANSTLEAFRFVPELQEALTDLKSKGAASSGGPLAALDVALADLYKQADESTKPVLPQVFLTRLRNVFPQFAEMERGGIYKQQDSDEFQNAVMTALANELTAATKSVPLLAAAEDGHPNIVDTLFGVKLDVELKCNESDAEPAVHKQEHHRKLVCNIDGGAGKTLQINHLHEGINLSLVGEVEKRSEILGRNAVWTKTAKISQLPKYLCVQSMRFFWKSTPDSRDHAGVKCKMLRPVTFPANNFDLYDFCTPALQAKLKVYRDKHLEESNPAKRARLEDGTAAPSPAPAPTPAPSAAAGGDDDELAAALRMSMEPVAGAGDAAVKSPDAGIVGYNLPAEFRGLYDLFAIVTHKGRDADSGHYISWVRKEQTDPTADKDAWLVFDDDTVSEVDTEYVTSRLKGGGDDHIAYLFFYKAKA